MKISKSVFGLLAGFGLLLMACNSTDSGTTPVSFAELVGQWYFRKVSWTGATHITYPDKRDTTYSVDTTISMTGTAAFIEFKSDSTYRAIFPDTEMDISTDTSGNTDGAETGTWSLSGNTLTTIAFDDYTTKVQVFISGSTLTGVVSHDTAYTHEGKSISGHSTMTYTLTK